jgi:membrane protein
MSRELVFPAQFLFYGNLTSPKSMTQTAKNRGNITTANLLGALKDAASGFMDDKALRMSASLSYYTVFSLAPMLLIIISVGSIFFGQEAIQGEVFGQIKTLVGADAAKQVQELLAKAELSNQTGMALITGIGTLLLGATAVFGEIQDSVNAVWAIRVKPKKGWLKLILNRLLSFSMLISISFLLLVSLVLNTFLDIFSNRINRMFNQESVHLFYALNFAAVFVVITCVFLLIFKVLPDGKLRWKDTAIGAVLTAILFLVGKWLISIYISKTDLVATYGSAGSVVAILVWVYYSSAILFFGAEFTKFYTKRVGHPIEPSREAVMVIEKEIDIHK